MLLRVSQRFAIAVWRNPVARRLMMQQLRRIVTAVVLTRAAELMATNPSTNVDNSERIIIPVIEE